MTHHIIGRVSAGGHQFTGTLKGSKLGFGKYTSPKSHTHAPSPGPAFETPGMNNAAKIAMPAK